MRPHTVGEWLLILQREVQEAIDAWLKGDSQAGLEEVLQVAAVAVACMEQHGVRERRAVEAIIEGLETGRFVFGVGMFEGRVVEISVVPNPAGDVIGPGAFDENRASSEQP